MSFKTWLKNQYGKNTSIGDFSRIIFNSEAWRQHSVASLCELVIKNRRADLVGILAHVIEQFEATHPSEASPIQKNLKFQNSSETVQCDRFPVLNSSE